MNPYWGYRYQLDYPNADGNYDFYLTNGINKISNLIPNIT